MTELHGIYITKLRKGKRPFGLKIGVSRVPDQRARAKNQKAFGYAEPYGTPEIGYDLKAVVEEIEKQIKKEFRRFRVETESNAEEIFFLEKWQRVVWAVRESLTAPKRCSIIAWCAANVTFENVGQLEVELFNSNETEWGCNLSSGITFHINEILYERFIPYRFNCPMLDIGYAQDTILTETPTNFHITYIVVFSIEPDPAPMSPCWSLCSRGGITFTPSERLDIEKSRSKRLRLPGYNNFSVKFTETLNKKTGQQKIAVSSTTGKPLGQCLEREILQAAADVRCV